MRILLTGATGYLGSRLCRKLIAEGHHVSALKRASSNLGRIGDLLQGVDLYDVSANGDQVIAALVKSVDCVVHLATCYGRKGESIGQVLEANTTFPLRLLVAAARECVPFINTDTVLPRNLNNYALSKVQFADWGRLVARDHALPFLNLRLDHFYGPGDDDLKFTTWVMQSCLRGVPELNLTPGEQKLDFIYVSDLVDAYGVLLCRACNGAQGFEEYGVGTGEPVTLREFVETVKRCAHSRTQLNFGALPYRAGEPMKYPNDTSRMHVLGWHARTSLEEGIRKSLNDEQAK